MVQAWRNSLYLILANPFYAFFTLTSAILLAVLSLAFTLPFIFCGMVFQGLLGNNAVLTLLARYDVIKSPRPTLP
jgi:hypothetical protein